MPMSQWSWSHAVVSNFACPAFWPKRYISDHRSPTYRITKTLLALLWNENWIMFRFRTNTNSPSTIIFVVAALFACGLVHAKHDYRSCRGSYYPPTSHMPQHHDHSQQKSLSPNSFSSGEQALLGSSYAEDCIFAGGSSSTAMSFLQNETEFSHVKKKDSEKDKVVDVSNRTPSGTFRSGTTAFVSGRRS